MSNNYSLVILIEGDVYSPKIILCPGHEWEPASYSPDEVLLMEVCIHCTVTRRVK